MSQSNIDRSPTYACRTCEKTQCGCKDVESPLPCHFYAKPVKQEPVLLSDVFSFLLGEKPLNGVWFGEKPEGVKGNFWWRTHLRKALAAPVQPVKQEPVAWDLAEKVRRDLDRQSCPGAYMDIAVESIVKHYAAPVQPVKQEPVGVVEASEEWGVAGVLIAGLPIGTKLYAAPVDAKAIRAEALEKAAKVCEAEAKEWEQAYLWDEEYAVKKCAAAIRAIGETK